jgi:phytoene dehydrogenase-like protein
VTSAIIVGSGPNGLAAALTLASEGVAVTVLEADARLGGGTRSGELTLPGLIHDECSAAHPLAVDNPFARRFDLAAHGLRWLWPDVQYSHPLDGGGGAAAFRSVAETAATLGADSRRWNAVFGWLAENFDALSEDILQPVLRVPSHPLKLARFGALSALSAQLLAGRLATGEARALLAGVCAHAMRPLASPFTASIGMVLGGAAHRYGWPVAQGGSAAITGAMIALLQEHGASLETGVTVRSLRDLPRADIVMLDVAPRAAVRIAADRLPPPVARGLTRFRYGPAAFKVDFAVDGGVPWSHEPSRRAGTLHLGGSMEEIAAGERTIHRGGMPERPFVLVCQQYLADRSRSRGDVHPVYAYAHVPAGYSADASPQIEAQIERFAPGFRDRVLARHIRTPADFEHENPNYIGGDIATGANDPRQLLFRPRVARDPYWLGAPGLYLCSAATPPGAGAHGMCGFNAAMSALRRLRGAPSGT